MYILKFHKSDKVEDMKIGTKEALADWVMLNTDGLIHTKEVDGKVYVKRYSKEIAIISEIEVIND